MVLLRLVHLLFIVPSIVYSSQVYNYRTRRKDHVRFDLRTPGHDLGIRTPGHDHCTVIIIIVILHCPFCRIVREWLFYDQRGSCVFCSQPFFLGTRTHVNDDDDEDDNTTPIQDNGPLCVNTNTQRRRG